VDARAAEPDGWPDVLTALLAGDDLSAPWAGWAMGEIMSGNATPVQISAFVVALRAKGETAGEVAALVEVMLAHAVALPVRQPCLDVVGTGGDRAGTVNVSTMAALVCAGAGARVIKHGNRAASSRAGTADVLEALGIRLDASPEQIAGAVDEVGIGFVFAPAFHPALRHAGPPRREIGVPTVFNVLGPLANPARPGAALIGCADARLAGVVAAAAAAAGQRALVVRGTDGLDEITPAAVTEVWDATGADVVRGLIDPGDFGVHGTVADLLGGDAEVNARLVREVLDGGRDGRLAVIAATVTLNAAAALVAWDAVLGGATDAPLVDRLQAAWPRAERSLESGAAAGVLDRWIAYLGG
jgi:anthranilate phosphoribosyltransferase